MEAEALEIQVRILASAATALLTRYSRFVPCEQANEKKAQEWYTRYQNSTGIKIFTAMGELLWTVKE